MTENLLLSGSQTDAFNQCKTKHRYAVVENLEPKEQSEALTKGSTGHKILEVTFKELQKGTPALEALELGLNAGLEYNATFAMEVFPWIAYFVKNVLPGLKWKILAVEVTEFLPVGPGLVYPFTCDVIVEISGLQVVIDWKFMADPFDSDLLPLLPQLPRYIGATNAIGKFHPTYALYVYFRTRSIKNVEDRIVISERVKPTKSAIIYHMTQQIADMKVIRDYEGSYPRTINKMNCGHCGFRKLCTAEVMGNDTELMKRTLYKENTYGYKEL